ncbi:MAG: T9SS type A sorting domain-containing protein [Bacteroidales bacterium]|nr:T9SS type A sorting domain-containing protein [Bacteroidales bacterium]
MKKIILLPALLFLFQIHVFPTIIIVNQSGTGNYTSIQEGINNANNGDTVLVYPGTYYENINFIGKNITVASLLLTTQDTTYISQTIINGNQNGSVVKFVSEESLNSVITGFTITNGCANNYPNDGGGGVKCVNSSPTIENNIIKENNCELYVHGGGIYCEKSSSHIINNVICYNEGAYYGGGIFVSDTSAVLINGNVIYNNVTASGYGVAFGGGICCGGNESNTLIENNTICNNTVDFGEGGGIYSNTLNTCVVNTIIWNNSPDEIDGEISITYSDIQGGWTGIGNIDADPLFADPANGDYHLTWANYPIPDETKSPCIDAGDPALPLDPDSTISDMGAFYFNQIITSVEPLIETNANHKLFQNYPNPFISKTTISFYIQKAGNVNIIIFNNNGKEIRTLVNKNQLSGKYSVVWDGKDNSGKVVEPGVYFYQLKTGNNFYETKKMLLLK